MLGSPDVPPGPVCFGYCSYDQKLASEQVGPGQLVTFYAVFLLQFWVEPVVLISVLCGLGLKIKGHLKMKI